MCRQVIQACLDKGRQCLKAKDQNALLLLEHAHQLISEDLVSSCTPLEYFRIIIINHQHNALS